MKLEELIIELQKMAVALPDAEASFAYVTHDNERVWTSHEIAFAEVTGLDALHCEVRFTEPTRLAEFRECESDLGMP